MHVLSHHCLRDMCTPSWYRLPAHLMTEALYILIATRHTARFTYQQIKSRIGMQVCGDHDAAPVQGLSSDGET